MTSTTIVGLGAMGIELARALLNAGGAVTVWNRTAARAAPLIADGARPAGTLRDAVEASSVTIFCIKSHDDTRALCADLGDAIQGKIIVDLSTGSAAEAAGLAADLEALGARWQIGMINVFPRDIGKPEASIFTVGPEDVWGEIAGRIGIIAGASRNVGSEPKMLAALFAAMFTTRQGFMCGMLHGAAVAKAAGLSPEIFAETLPISVGLAEAYSETFRRTVLKDSYDNPGASIATYSAAFDDALGTFEMLSAPADLPRLMSGLVREAADAGFGDQELTAIYKMLAARIGRA
jgi:3-hydroxyisobutyrate dehydrogenase-like beta-hydroxyacid dehydrogenase